MIVTGFWQPTAPTKGSKHQHWTSVKFCTKIVICFGKHSMVRVWCSLVWWLALCRHFQKILGRWLDEPSVHHCRPSLSITLIGQSGSDTNARLEARLNWFLWDHNLANPAASQQGYRASAFNMKVAITRRNDTVQGSERYSPGQSLRCRCWPHPWWPSHWSPSNRHCALSENNPNAQVTI